MPELEGTIKFTYKYKPIFYFSFSYDGEGFVKVYVDGSCIGNGTPRASAGIGVYWDRDGHPLNVSQRASKATNNVAEIETVRKAVEIAKNNQIRKLNIISDSMYVRDCLAKWMPKWKKNGWKTCKNEPVKNQKELEQLESSFCGLSIKLTHVKAHSGNSGNDKADDLAKRAARK